MVFYQLVLLLDLLAGGCFGRVKLILDKFEHKLERRQRKYQHHHTAHAGCDLKVILRMTQVV